MAGMPWSCSGAKVKGLGTGTPERVLLGIVRSVPPCTCEPGCGIACEATCESTSFETNTRDRPKADGHATKTTMQTWKQHCNTNMRPDKTKMHRDRAPGTDILRTKPMAPITTPHTPPLPIMWFGLTDIQGAILTTGGSVDKFVKDTGDKMQ